MGQIVRGIEGPEKQLTSYFKCSERLLVGLKLGSDMVNLNVDFNLSSDYCVGSGCGLAE